RARPGAHPLCWGVGPPALLRVGPTSAMAPPLPASRACNACRPAPLASAEGPVAEQDAPLDQACWHRAEVAAVQRASARVVGFQPPAGLLAPRGPLDQQQARITG